MMCYYLNVHFQGQRVEHVPNKFVAQNDAFVLCAMHFRRIYQIIAKMDYSLRSSVRLAVRMEELGSRWTDNREILQWKIFPETLQTSFVENPIKIEPALGEDTHNYVTVLYNGQKVLCEARDKTEETVDELKIRIEADKCPV